MIFIILGIVVLYLSIIVYLLVKKKYTDYIGWILGMYLMGNVLYRIFFNVFNYTGYDFTVFSAEIGILLGVISIFFNGQIKWKGKINIFTFVFLFYFLLFISAFFTYPDILIGLYGIRWVVIPPMILFFLFTHEQNINIDKIVLFLIIFAFINIMYAFLQIFIRMPFDYLPEIKGNKLYIAVLNGIVEARDLPLFIGDKLRPYGLLDSVVNFSNTIPLIVIFVSSLLYNNYKKYKKQILFLFFIYILFLSFAYYEKAQIATMLIGFSTMLILGKNKGKRLIYVLLIASSFITFLIIAKIYVNDYYVKDSKDPYLKRFMEILKPTEGTGGHRIEVAKQVLVFAKDHAFGVGLGYARSNSASRGKSILPHNMYLQFLVEIGWFGLFFFICIFGYLIIVFFKQALKGNSFAVGFLSVLVAMGMYGLATTFFERANSLVFWIMCFISYKKIKRKEINENTN